MAIQKSGDEQYATGYRGASHIRESVLLAPLAAAICIYAAVHGTAVFHSALSDSRNFGTGLRETIALTHKISRERFAKRDVPTLIYVFGLPSVITLLVVSLIFG